MSRNRSHGKESTEVRLTQNKGRESENFFSLSFPYFALMSRNNYLKSCVFFIENVLIDKSDTVKMTVLMQSTLARLTVSMYAESPSPSRDDLKLVIDMEDIMNSLDFQQIYLKVKCKIALANIKHYVR